MTKNSKNFGADNNLLRIMVQGFYGNRTMTEICKEDMDAFILGYMDNSLPITEEIDRTIVHIPNTENLVVIYNKYQEESAKNSECKSLAIVPVNNTEIYSRCIACRMNNDGEFESLQNDDCNIIKKYFAE
jgi:hypothetical protein